MFVTKLTFGAFVAATLALAQVDLSKLPECALTPAIAAIGSTGCALTDFGCVCSDKSFISSMSDAVLTTCTAGDVGKTIAFAQDLCSSVGVVVQPGASNSSSSTTSATSTSAPSTTQSTKSAQSSATSRASSSASATSSVASTSPTSTTAPTSEAMSHKVSFASSVIFGLAICFMYL